MEISNGRNLAHVGGLEFLGPIWTLKGPYEGRRPINWESGGEAPRKIRPMGPIDTFWPLLVLLLVWMHFVRVDHSLAKHAGSRVWIRM